MKYSGVDITEEMRPYLAVGYDVPITGQPLRCLSDAHQDMGVAAAANQLYSSVEELAHFVSLQFHEGPADKAHILKGSSTREMHAPVLINPGWQSATGIGWRLLHFMDHTVLRHTGGALGFSTAMMVVPALKLGIMALRNTSPDGNLPRNIAGRGLELLIPVIEDLQTRSTYPIINEIPKEWYVYEGNYYRYSKYQQEKIRKMVRIEHGKLLWYHTDSTTVQSEFVPEGEAGSFRMQGGPFHRERALFVTDEHGQVQHVKMGNRIFLRDDDYRRIMMATFP
jgi:CubicO group peptidase (beta-lactamase class C family)